MRRVWRVIFVIVQVQWFPTADVVKEEDFFLFWEQLKQKICSERFDNQNKSSKKICLIHKWFLNLNLRNVNKPVISNITLNSLANNLNSWELVMKQIDILSIKKK